MHWQLWDTESNNLVEEFATEDEALRGVRELLTVNRPDYLNFLTLGAMYDEGEPHDVELPPVLEGDELRARLTATAPRTAAMRPLRVTITDKDALRALSWKAVQAYLDAAGWRQVEDIPGTSLVYQHTDQNGRLWEIIVLLRDDLADYVSRMADAVTTLARVEDRSELDVYADLHALGTSSAQDTNGHVRAVDGAMRAVHDRIRRWLAEENWTVEDVPDPEAVFNVMVTLQGGPRVNIYQRRDHPDHITIAQRWGFVDPFRSDFEKIPKDAQEDVISDIYRDVLMVGVEFGGLAVPLKEMWFNVFVYFDGSPSLLVKTLAVVGTICSDAKHSYPCYQSSSYQSRSPARQRVHRTGPDRRHPRGHRASSDVPHLRHLVGGGPQPVPADQR
jgi:hypothetical protein